MLPRRFLAILGWLLAPLSGKTAKPIHRATPTTRMIKVDGSEYYAALKRAEELRSIATAQVFRAGNAEYWTFEEPG